MQTTATAPSPVSFNKNELLQLFDHGLDSLRQQAGLTLDKLYEAALKSIEAERLRLEEEKRKFAEVQQKILSDQAKNSTILKLDVGGVKYVTTRDTLCKPGSYFEAMFSGRHELAKVDGDYYFLDRDGKVFGAVLEYLRTGTCLSLPEGVTQEQLENELDYFLLGEEKPEEPKKQQRKTPIIEELKHGATIFVKEKPQTQYNYGKAAREHFGQEAVVTDLFFSGNALQQIGVTFNDNFSYYYSCQDLEIVSTD